MKFVDVPLDRHKRPRSVIYNVCPNQLSINSKGQGLVVSRKQVRVYSFITYCDHILGVSVAIFDGQRLAVCM
jgi:hypothetical protein